MTYTQRTVFLGTALLAILAAALFYSTGSMKALGASTQVPGITLHTINQPPETQDYYTFFTATTTTATSTTASSSQSPGFMRVGGAKDVIFFFSRGDTKGTGNTGNSTFKVQVTPDGTNWFDYNELGFVSTSTTADLFYTRVASATITAATSTVQYAMEDISYYGVRCIAVRATDGESSCTAVASF